MPKHPLTQKKNLKISTNFTYPKLQKVQYFSHTQNPKSQNPSRKSIIAKYPEIKTAQKAKNPIFFFFF